MAKKIIIFTAPPGAGKGTQAEIIAKKLNIIHFDTGPFLRELYAKASPQDEKLQKEKAIWLSGELNSPEFVTEQVMEQVKKIIAEYDGAVFSGSPRTVYEAENEMPFFERLVGRENIHIFFITLSKEESVKRNSSRLVCEKNKHPIPNLPEYQKIRKTGVCPEDGSRLIRRELDNPVLAAERYEVFLRDTKPVLDVFKKMRYPVIEINGEQPIEKVAEDILKHL